MKLIRHSRFIILLSVMLSSGMLEIKGQITTFPWTEDFGNPTCVLPAGFTNTGSDPWDFQNTNETYMLGTDHTSGSGCFASMDDSGTALDDSCLLETPSFDLTSIPSPSCGFWWQNSNGTTSQPSPTGPRPWSNLYVDVSTDSGNTWTRDVFVIADSQQVGWAYAEFDLSTFISTNTKIRFRGLETQSFYSDFALDDISVFNVSALDLSVTQVIGVNGICPGSVNVSAELTNVGQNTISSATINWSVNGVIQTPVAYTGSIAYLNTDVVALGSFTAVGNTPYDILVWSTAPNAGVDGDNGNDTASVLDLMTGLTGTFTIGAAGDFLTIVDAVNEMNTNGICGPVTFNVSNATYNGQVAIGNIVGASSTNTVTFNGNGATISAAPNSTDRYVVLLDGANYITLDSFNIVGTDLTYGYGILLTNGANYNSINGCVIDLTAVTSTSSTNSTGILASGSTTSTSTAGDNANYCTFSNNTILGGTTGVYYGIRLNGNTGGLNCVGNVIENNIIQDIYAYNIYLDDTDSNIVRQNDISRAGKTSVTTFYGIYVLSSTGTIIERNRIHNTHDVATSLTGTVYPIFHSSSNSTSSKPSVVYNNLIYNINGTGTVYALYNSASSGVYYLYNTTSLDDASATAGITRGFYQTSAATDIIIANNIFSITRGGSGAKHGLYFNTNTSSIVSDNNIVYVNSSGTGAQSVGRWDGVDYNTFMSWQTANSGAFDQVSDSADPMYVNLITADFTPTTASGNNIGYPIPEIPTDFFGTLRDTMTPDPGAIEFVAVHPNDSCQNAITITSGITTGNTIDATTDNVAACVVGNDPSGGLWYKYTGVGDFVSLSLCNSTFDTRVRVFTGSCGALVCETGNDDSCSTQSQVGWCSVDSTDYYILVYGNGEEGQFEMEITETASPAPTITAIPDSVFCTGDSVVLESSAAGSYLWNDPSSTTSRELVVFAAGTFMVTITDSNGCVKTSEAQIVLENLLPSVSLGIDTSICSSESITLDAGTGVSFVWSTGDTSQAITYNGINGDTTIMVVVTDTNGCTGDDEINIIEKPSPIVMLGNDTTICHNAEITLDAGTGGSSYSWSTGATTQTITYSGSNGNATIAVIVTGGNGCAGEDEIIINVDICGSVDEIDGKDLFNVYPNPNDGLFTINFSEPTSERMTLNLMNLQGKLVYSEVFYMNTDSNKEIDLRNQAKGVYTIIVQGSTFIQTEKLIVR